MAIAHDGEHPSLVLDAGTGLRNLSRLFDGEAFHGTIVLGHLHWDHVIGLPFFSAGDRPDAEVQVLVPEQGIDPVDVLSRLMAPPLFPITVADLRGNWQVGSYTEGVSTIEGFQVLARDIPHTAGRTMGLRVSDGHSAIAYLSDHSPHDLGPGADGLGVLHEAAVELVSGVDVLIHDAQYTSHELLTRRSWGHTAAEYCVTLAEHCGVKRVVLFHHDPWRTDEQVVAMRDALALTTAVQVDAAIEGTVIQLSPGTVAHQ